MGNLLTLGLSTASLLQNTEYKLAAGNGWNGISAQSNSLEYYNAVFSADNDGLRVKFSLKDANTIWMGDGLNTSWSGSKFGPDTRVPGESETAVFNDLAESRNVQVQGQQCAAKLLFDSTKEYTVAGTTGEAGLTANNLLQTGSGTTKPGAGVTISDAVEVPAGTLVLQEGSHAGSSADRSLTVESGKLNVTGTLNVLREASVHAGATLQSNTGNLLAQEGQALQLAGTLVVDTGSSNMALNTDVIGYDGAVGTVEKIGNNTLTVKSGLPVDTLAVKEGRVEIRDSGILMDFLANTRSLETMNGGYAMLGGNAFTLESDEYKTNLVVGNRSTIEPALGQHSTKTFQGGLSMADGATLKLFDGGLQINGNISLGTDAGDRVILQGNWGEAGSNAVMVNHVTFDTTIGVNASLTPASAPVLLTAGTGDTPTLAAENRPSAVLMLSNAESVTLTGTDLTLNLRGISYEELISYGIVGIAVGGNNGSFDEQLNVAVRWGEQQANTYHQNNDGMVYFNTDDLTNVPEPTTGTLSLLALAALCSRRRRKG